MKWPRWVVTLTVLVALAAGCSATAPTLPTPSAATLTASAPTDTNPVPRDRVAEGGMVRLPLAALPLAWNPWHAAGATPEAVKVRGPVSSGAFTFDAAGRPTPDPDFLSNVTVAHEGRTVVTLSLNPRAVWADGQPITAADWVATWRALGGGDAAYQVADGRGWAGVSEVRAGVTDHEVVVAFAGIEPDWSRPLAAGAARAESVQDAAAFNSGWPEYRAGWFSGPFVVAHVDRAQGVVTLDRNPLWWGDAPRLEHVVFRTIQPEALAAAFQHNEFDWLEPTTADSLAKARVAPDTVVRSAPGTSGRLLRVDTSGRLGDPALRTALLRALDRTAIGRADLAGLADTVQPWANQLLLTNQPGYVDEAVATGVDRDHTAAAEAFTRAGWALSGGRRTRDGVPLTLTMAVASDARARSEFEVVAATLDDLGVTLTSTDGAADLTPVTVPFDRYPLAAVRALTDPALADLVLRVSSEVTAARRADQAAQLSRRLWTDAGTIPLHQPPQVVAVRAALANLGAGGFASVRWQDVGWVR